ncbi:hypothetical protein BC937DRAFT_86361 [Endogone sp. FLAS-F59071]|nr:hypothetical protein BC937DRAFT_86361 [Endogone sp. FLAS-F59071]|eukprot:RUS20099.1 hypothetical protein BC937DRAFT_86361 [Endogone sp. FLAS-F59071]
MTTLTLCCCILGTDPYNSFTIDVQENDNVSMLRKAIYEMSPHSFAGIDAHQLVLWLVNIPLSIDENEQVKILMHDNIDIKTQLNGVKLLPSRKINKVFSQEPDEDYIHVIVECPPGM